MRKEVSRLSTQTEETRSGVDVIRTTLKSTNDDVVTMSTSFTEFISHFDNYSIAVASNFTTLTEEMLASITTINSLNKKVSSFSSESQTSAKQFSTQLGSLETGFNVYKNFTLQKFEKIEKEIELVDMKMVNRTTMEQLMGQISQEILEVGNLAAANISSVASGTEKMLATMQESLKNSSKSFDSVIDSLKLKTMSLEERIEELRKAAKTFRNDLTKVDVGLDKLSGSHEDRWRNNDLNWVKTTANLADLTGAVDKLEEKIGILETLAPFLHHVNSSTISSIETLRSNITNLGQATESLRAGFVKLELALVDSNSSHSNSTVSLKKRALKIETKVDKLQTDTNDFLTGFAKLVEVQREAFTNLTRLRENVTAVESSVADLSQSMKKSEANSTQLQVTRPYRCHNLTSLPLARSRWVRSTFSIYCPLSSKQRH